MSALRHKWTAELAGAYGTSAECKSCHCIRLRLRKVFGGVVRIRTVYKRYGATGRSTKHAPACVETRLL